MPISEYVKPEYDRANLPQCEWELHCRTASVVRSDARARIKRCARLPSRPRRAAPNTAAAPSISATTATKVRAGKGGPPILIAGTKPRMMSLIAKYADRWNSVWYGLPTDEFRAERSNLQQACGALGRDANEIEISAGIQISAESGQPNDDGFLY